MLNLEKNPDEFDAYVTIAQPRYEELLDCETRVSVLIEMLKRDPERVSEVEICMILGFDKAAKDIEKKIEEDRIETERYFRELREQEKARLKKLEEERGNEA